MTSTKATAFDRIVTAIESRGLVVKSTGRAKVSAQCPAHEDRAPSLSITGIETQALLNCHAGCETVDVLAALGLTMADLYDTKRGADYRYDNGRVVHRKLDKSFPQSGTSSPPELYRLAKVRAAVADSRPVFVVEGEKDVHALEALGVTATCAPMGAGKWGKVDPSPLYGGRVLVIADQDASGRAHAADVARSLSGRAEVAIFAPKYGKDAADHIAAGFGVDDLIPAGSAEKAGSAGSRERHTGAVLDDVREWLGRFICTVSDDDLDLLTLWAAHTFLVEETYTTARLLIDSPVPAAGKTTTLEHLARLCRHPVQMASLSSPALLTRMLEAGIRTILIDEADRSLSPDKDGVGDLIAVLNSGYKRGATRPVLVPVKGGGWDAAEMSTFAPVAMAGNNPNLPDDTRSRSIRVLLLPDVEGRIEDSDWEEHDETARALGEELAQWADRIRDDVRAARPALPEACRGRARERWGPLKRVAVAAGGRWPDVVDRLAELDVRRLEAERDEGLVQQRPAVVLLTHLHTVWGEGETFLPTTTLLTRLVHAFPEMWGSGSSFGKTLTAQRLGRMLVGGYNIHSDRPDAAGPRGYLRTTLRTAFRRFGLDPLTLSEEPARPATPAEPAGSEPAEPAEPAGRRTLAEVLAMTPDAASSCPGCGSPTAGAAGDLCLECAAAEIAYQRSQESA